MTTFRNHSMSWKSKLLLAIIVPALVSNLVACRGSKVVAETVSTTPQATYASPAEAGKALQEASRAKDQSALLNILGQNSRNILSSGDPAEDAAGLESFVTKYNRMSRWVKMTDGSQYLYIGADNYTFPIPLVQNSSSKWYFNTKAGEDEILARRIGRNELLAIDACRAIANAEELYFKKAHDGVLAHHYTTLIISSPGKQDGLYWSVPAGEHASPLGRVSDFIKTELSFKPAGEPQMLDGYYFRILTAQGDKAKGGVQDYLVDGKLTRGFAIVATPVKYRDSGIMTFIMNRDGVVYQRDLGDKAGEPVSSITDYNPSSKWVPAD